MSTQNLLNLKIHKVTELPSELDPAAIYLTPDEGHSHGNMDNDGKLGTASRVVVTDSNKKITTSSDISTTELGCLDGVTSNIQTQLDDRVIKNTDITGSTKCKITYDSKGLVTSGANLAASDIPQLASNKITAMTSYTKASSVSAISTSDSLNAAIGKLEKALDGKATSGHTHTTKISSSTSTSEITLAYGGIYQVTAGGDSFVFKMPSSDDTDSKAASSDTDSQIYLIGATAQSYSGRTTYSHAEVYVDTSHYVNATGFKASSDKRLKENITPYKCEKSILDLPIYEYNFINSKNTKQIGCLAQDLQLICPELVSENDKGYLSIQESKIVYLLLDEVRKLKKELDTLKNNLR